MFSGEKVLVDLRCDNSLMKTMVDRFGEDVTTLQGHFTDTVHMPVCRCKINPFLAAVTACRTVKVSIHTRIGLIKDADKIIAMDNSLLAVRDINHQYIVVATCKEKAVCAICGIHYG